VTDLNRFVNQNAKVAFDHFLMYYHKSDKYLVASDSEGFLTILKFKGDKGGATDYLKRVFI
jgi:hypothetical protein